MNGAVSVGLVRSQDDKLERKTSGKRGNELARGESMGEKKSGSKPSRTQKTCILVHGRAGILFLPFGRGIGGSGVFENRRIHLGYGGRFQEKNAVMG